MNKNKMLGSLNEAVGKFQEKIGKALGRKQQQAQGIRKQLEGKVQKKFGAAEEEFRGVLGSHTI